MEGNDVRLLSNIYAFPKHYKKYGGVLLNGTYQVPVPWQAGLNNGANVGVIFGLFINGWAFERFGYRYTVMLCLTLIIDFTIYSSPRKTSEPLKSPQSAALTYAAKVCPTALRGYLITYVNFCWGLGQLISIRVIKSMLPRTDQWTYRIPYALQ
ncbi:MAG: hypothetical protein MMC23_009429 [Stictis urceolatum]|nr:hypothetical protein [Stictis urceolata]